MRSERYQIVLISLGIVAAIFLGAFLYRELFPEYRIYQDDYVELEKFRSTYTGEPASAFQMGVKQIVFERDDKGPAHIDRCTSCHAAEEIPDFSPTKIALDVNGNIERSDDGTPIQIANENYIWGKLDQKIAELRDVKVSEQLEHEGAWTKLKERQKEASRLEGLKIAAVGDQLYDVSKVLSMHPLMGKETRPFEYHPLDQYGCTVCHSGNGRGLTSEKAHGPVFDGQYEVEYMGPKPEFTERDKLNDPSFARIFNYKPGDALLFQTTPILVGNLIQARCIQCHEQSATAIKGLSDRAGFLSSQREKKNNAIKEGFDDEKEALFTLLRLKQLMETRGISGALSEIDSQLNNPALTEKKRNHLFSQKTFLMKNQEEQLINVQLQAMLGSQRLVESLESEIKDQKNHEEILVKFLNDNYQSSDATGTLFAKWETQNLQKSLLSHLQETQQSILRSSEDENAIASMASDIDTLTKNYHRGKELYLSQACYACHRIAGFARGGVGPELTREGENYPWFIKESIVWPQADLKTSTMPNFVLDHLELSDLMTFLLAQKGPTRAISEIDYKIALQEWESGRKMSWEKPIPPSEIHHLHYSMTVFAVEGCASCHRLEGYQSNVGFRIEKEGQASFDEIYKQREWFKKLIPEESRGSDIVKAIENHADEIDKRIVDGVREGSILEEIAKKYPDSLESLYSNFRFAARAKNHFYSEMAAGAVDQDQKKQAQVLLTQWKERIHRLLMMYIQEYGLGRLICPKLNWSGVYRSDEWLMEHFRNPVSHTPRSIMPVFPFDDSKFYALTYMLDVLGKRNRDAVHAVWQHRGFDPNLAFQIHCAECHGEFLSGNGPVATWIYPIPKDLRSAEFLRNLTKENAALSIMHGVKGTPMPPWGETPKDKENYDGMPVLSEQEVSILVDWLFSSLPGNTVIKDSKDVPKWNYTPQEVVEEMQREIQKPLSSESEASKIFDIVPNPYPDEGEYAYYIKKKYYTEENINSGKRFFEMNCAICHGAEADGSGVRAGVMAEAKPRMLTNLDWLKMRDDLRLLRSIKYGVPGTAMTPWGDLTSSLQRLQLVMFIRSLSDEKEKRDELAETLYQSFEKAEMRIEKVRSIEYEPLNALQNEYKTTRAKQKEAYKMAELQPQALQSALNLYQKQMKLEIDLDKQQLADQRLVDLQKLLQKEREVYQGIGNDMLTINVDDGMWKIFINMIESNANRFELKNKNLTWGLDAHKEGLIENFVDEIVKMIDDRLSQIKKSAAVVQGRLPSFERNDEAKSLDAKIASYEKLKAKLLAGYEENTFLRQQEHSLYQQYRQNKTYDNSDSGQVR